VQEFDLVVIGGGSAGLKAARTAARNGFRVAVAEEVELGGECHWAGCVPTKAMIRAADVWHLVGRAAEFGCRGSGEAGERQKVKGESPTPPTENQKPKTKNQYPTPSAFAEAMAYKDRAVHAVGGDGPEDAGLSTLGAAYFHQRATFEGPHEVRIGKEVVRGERIVLATGTVPHIPPIPGLAEAGFITNREAVNLTCLPKCILVLGGGPIGLEFAQAFHRFGAEVIVIEQRGQILPSEDEEIAALAAQYLREEGLQILTDTLATRVVREGDRKRVTVQTANGSEEIACDEILVATGRRAAVEGLNIEATGLTLKNGYLSVDSTLRTEVPHILAPGDVSGGYLFTHVASYEGRIAALNAFNSIPETTDYSVIPRCTFLDPEIASVGQTESEALAARGRIAVYTSAFADLDRAILHGDPRGMVKIIADPQTGSILGAHILGPMASSLLGEVALAMKHNLPVRAIADTMHAYPSFPEAIESAALSAPVYRG
jgi:pyruvate/2-oxoglutarate dehydrogenase complex dihydrolipoamide dehydrogenase (E3) component